MEESAGRTAKGHALGTRGARAGGPGFEAWAPHASGVDEKLAVLREKLCATTPSKDSTVDSAAIELEREQALLDAELKLLMDRKAVLQRKTEHFAKQRTTGSEGVAGDRISRDRQADAAIDLWRPAEETPTQGGTQGREPGLDQEVVDVRWTEGMPRVGEGASRADTDNWTPGARPEQGDFRAMAAAYERVADAHELMAQSQRVKSGEAGDPRGHKYDTSNSQFLQNRFMLSACGQRESGGFLPDAYHGNSYAQLLFIKFRNPVSLYRQHDLNFELTPSMYLAAVRGLLEPLALGSFRDDIRSELPLRPTKITVPLRVETGIQPPESIYEIERCCTNFVTFVRVAFNPQLANACTKFFDALFKEYRNGEDVLELEDLVAAADDVKRQIDTNTYESRAKIESLASLDPSTGAINGTSSAALRARKHIALTKDGEGHTIMTPPEYGLDPKAEYGLLQELIRAKKARMEAHRKAQLKEDLKRHPFGNEQAYENKPGLDSREKAQVETLKSQAAPARAPTKEAEGSGSEEQE